GDSVETKGPVSWRRKQLPGRRDGKPGKQEGYSAVPELSPRDSLDRVNQYSLHSAICTAHCFLIKTISQPTAPAELSRTLVQHRAGHGPRAAQSQSRLRPGRDGRKEMKRAFLMMSIVLATAVSAFASATGSITGTVTDKTGSVIPGAAVDAVSVETG